MVYISKMTVDMIVHAVENLTAGGGVTAPDDMVNIDDVICILNGLTCGLANVDKHAEIVEELTSLYARKNMDYGDSFAQGYKEFGTTMPIIRLQDKLMRAKRLVLSNEQHVKDESLRDTLLDMANYSIMTVIEMDMARQKS